MTSRDSMTWWTIHLCDLMESTYRQASGQARPPVMLGILNGKTYTSKRPLRSSRVFVENSSSEKGKSMSAIRYLMILST